MTTSNSTRVNAVGRSPKYSAARVEPFTHRLVLFLVIFLLLSGCSASSEEEDEDDKEDDEEDANTVISEHPPIIRMNGSRFTFHASRITHYVPRHRTCRAR